MDKLQEYYLFNPQDLIRGELQSNLESNYQQNGQDHIQKTDMLAIGKHKNQKYISSNNIMTIKNLKSRKLLNYVNKIDSQQQKQDDISLQQQRNSLNLLSRNIMSPNNGYKTDTFRNQSQSYSQTLQNYKWIQFLPQSRQKNQTTEDNQQTPNNGMFQQEYNFHSPQNNQKVSISEAKQKLSSSAVYLQSNLPLTPHERVMRIKNKQHNLDVLRYINNPVLGVNNSLFDNDLDIFAKQVDQTKNNTFSQDKINSNSLQANEQNTKQKEGLFQMKFENKVDYINNQNQKYSENLFNSSNTNIDNNEIDSQKQNIFHKVLRDNISTPQTQQKNVSVQVLNGSDKYKQSKQNQMSLNNKDQGLNNRKFSGTQSHSAAWRIYKRGVYQNERGSSNQIQRSDKVDKSPIQKLDGTWSHSFYKFSNDLNKQFKTFRKRKKSQDFEDFLENQTHSQQRSLDQQDQIPYQARLSYLNSRDEYDLSAQPQNFTSKVHKSLGNNKLQQIQQQYREQFKNIHLLLNFEHQVEQVPQKNSPLRNKPFVQSKIETKKHSISSLSNRIHKVQTPKQKESSKKSTDQEQEKDIKRETFLSSFPVQKQSQEFRFSKLNIKRKNPQLKQNTFKL